MATLREMATANGVAPPTRLETTREATVLAEQWRRLARAATAVAILTSPAPFLSVVFLVQLANGEPDITWLGTAGAVFAGIGHALGNAGHWATAVYFFVFFIFNFAILLGPLLFMGISQIRGY